MQIIKLSQDEVHIERRKIKNKRDIEEKLNRSEKANNEFPKKMTCM